MEKDSKRLIMSANPILFLAFISLVYAALFVSHTTLLDEWKQRSSNWRVSLGTRNINKGVEPSNWRTSVGTRKVYIDHKGVKPESLKSSFKGLVKGEAQAKLDATGYTCHEAPHSEMCVTNKPVRINTQTMTVLIPTSNDDHQTIPQDEHIVKPYPRRDDSNLMNTITPIHILHLNTTTPPPPCNHTHYVPTIIFSSGGFVGNLFHEFNEVIIPLFITSRPFRSRVQFILSDHNPSFVSKYSRILSQLSDFEILHPNRTSGIIHCFPGAVIGLQYHDNLAINANNILGEYSILDFKQFLREAYNLKVWTVSEIEKPLLVLISRRSSRAFLNEDEMVSLMKELGFRVIVATPKMMKNIEKFSQVVNSCSVMVGIHGAGLANELFLPNGAVMVQVVPLGLEWASTAYFGEPSKDMDVHYLEYKVEPEESSLFKLYGKDDPIVVDQASMRTKGYQFFRTIYVDGQHVRINVVRFRETLVQALSLLGPEISQSEGDDLLE